MQWNVYIAARDLGKIFACERIGLYCTVLNYNVSATSLALDPRNGTMYWASEGENAAIFRQGMDGSNTQPFVSQLNSPDALILDPVLDRLYWTHRKDVRCIEKINLDGTGRKMILQDPRYSPRALSIFEDTLYWSDHINGTIYTCNKFTGENVSVQSYSGKKIIVTHDVLTKTYSSMRMQNPCTKHSCQHLCLIASKDQYRCGCTEGWRLKDDNASCSVQRMSPRLYVSEGVYLRYLIPDDISDYTLWTVPLSGSNAISDVAYDWKNDIVFVAEFFQGISVIQNSVQKMIVEGGIGKIFSLCYDHIGENLYWLDNDLEKIEVATRNGSFRTVLLRIPGFDFALHPEEGTMYVVLRSYPTYISIYDMDGSSRGSLEGTDHISHITFNSFTGDLYWFSRKNNTIMRYNTAVKSRAAVLETDGEVESFAITEHHLYWIEEGQRHLNYSLLSDTKTAKTIRLGGRYPVHLSYVHPVPSKKVCVNSQCDHLCLIVPGGYKCACSEGYLLDRDNHTCSEKQCRQDEFKCDNGECLEDVTNCKHGQCNRSSRRCNGIKDCNDDSDEKGCNSTSGCNTDQFLCANGRCTPLDYRCDGINDCKDNSDEHNCRKNVPLPCPEPMFHCNNMECLPLSLVCDSRKDCPSGKDELNCANHTCPASHHRCNSGQCIENELWCDGKQNCADESDEVQCNTTPKVCEGMFSCKSGLCISYSSICDNKYDCPGNEDEENCESTNCTADGMQCANGQCILRDDICDGDKDCPDGKDEENCTSRPCNSEELTCLSGTCILRELRCDGFRDCDDGSDEYNCLQNTTTTIAPHCTEGGFYCSSGECINETKVCDGEIDCFDTSDEGGNCSFHCDRNNGGCTQICKSTAHGPKCSCNKGYILSKDESSCLDIDECQKREGSCGHYCHNTKGSYYCSCEGGYSLLSDGKGCWPHGKFDIIETFLVGKFRVLLVPNGVSFLGSEEAVTEVDYDNHEKSVIWADSEKDVVMSCLKNCTERKEIIRGIAKPEKVAYDWVAQNYYISSPEGIHACGNSSGEMLCATITNSVVNVTSIALVADKGLLFCAVSSIRSTSSYVLRGNSGAGKIVRIDMDGSAITVLLEKDVHYPVDIAIDPVHETVYWGDPVKRMIESMKFDGTNRKTVARHNVTHPRSLSLLGNMLQWSDWESELLRGCMTFDCKNINYIANPSGRKSTFKWFHPVSRPSANNPCAEKKCEDLCLLSRSGATCICRNGYVATTDGCRRAFCSADYCLNSGVCEREEDGVKCRCSSGYDGERCERISSSIVRGIVIAGVVIAIVIAVLLAGFILWKRKSVVTGAITIHSFRDLQRREDKVGLFPTGYDTAVSSCTVNGSK